MPNRNSRNGLMDWLMNRRVVVSVLVAVFVMVGLVSPVIAQASSDAVLVLHFDEGSGTIAKDASGHGNEGTIYGATWTEGISGKALRFDGVDDYVDCGSDTFSDIGAAFTVEAWIKPADVNGNHNVFEGGQTNDYNDFFRLGIYDGKVQFALMIGGSVKYDRRTPNEIISTGIWQHLVGVADGVNHPKIYLDGEEQDVILYGGSGDYTKGLSDMVGTGDKYFIGKEKTDNINRFFFSGILDEVAIYNKALSPEEIEAHYLAKRAGSPTTTLSLTKTASPHSIKQDQKTLVKITVENTGTTTIKDIDVVDTPPADFEFVSGDTSAKYGSLKPRESRTFQYTLRSGDTGKFDLGHATATHADEEGNYHTVKSNTPLVEVIASLEKPEIPAREEKNGTPGFEAVFAVVGLLVVVYVLRRKK